MKKLYMDCNQNEKRIVNEKLINVDTKTVKIVGHAKQRMREKNIGYGDLFRVFKSFEVIEIHIKNDDVRVLLRGRLQDRLGRNICLSYSLSNSVVITAYPNMAMDNHTTLNRNNYEDINVESFLKIN